eukprot:TRINITY_DN4961_c0_g1_i2.p1 TRINITY_DN4961_c0_g1~~TRINITY_DN4961_c0_g1_i2.p1  ORF type:complete len:1277 (+),score=173.11 TRINITY_DN4961_c0_g1_i2:69-3899(+)
MGRSSGSPGSKRRSPRAETPLGEAERSPRSARRHRQDAKRPRDGQYHKRQPVCVERFADAAVSRTLRPCEPDEEVKRKQAVVIGTVVITASLVLSACADLASLSSTTTALWTTCVLYCFMLAWLAWFYLWLSCRRKLSSELTTVWLVPLVVTVAAIDTVRGCQGDSADYWLLLVVPDFLIMAEAGPGPITALCTLCSVYAAARSFIVVQDNSFCAALSLSQGSSSSGSGNENYARQATYLVSWSVVGGIHLWLMLLLRMRGAAERRRGARAVRLVERVCGAVSRFDIRAAENIVSAGFGARVCAHDGACSDQATCLRYALLQVVSVLRRYRPYLPDALLEHSTLPTDVVSPGQLSVAAAFRRRSIAVLCIFRRTRSAPPLTLGGPAGATPDRISPKSLASDSQLDATAPQLAGLLPQSTQFQPRGRSAPSTVGQTPDDFDMVGAPSAHGISQWLTHVMDVVRRSRGAVHSFDAGQIVATFGAVAASAASAAQACGCADSLVQGGDCNCGVAFGDADVGYLRAGEDEGARMTFQVMGPVMDNAKDLARLAVEAGIAALCSAQCASQAQGAVRLQTLDLDGTKVYRIVDELDEAATLRLELGLLGRLPDDRCIPMEQLSTVKWSLIGRGSCGSVYQAHYSALQDSVAVKELAQGSFGGLPQLRKRVAFEREIQSLNQLRVNQIVNFYGWSEGEQGQLYMITEFCARGGLRDLISEPTLRPVQRARIALDMGLAVAQALSYIHGRNLVHLDVAARNILVNTSGQYKLSDVGLITKEGVHAPVISYPWSPPEAVRCPAPRRQAHRSHDSWSFGILLYEALEGRGPFWELAADHPSPKAWLDAVVDTISRNEHPAPARAVVATPECLLARKLWNQVVLPCWSIERSERPVMSEAVQRIIAIRDDPDALAEMVAADRMDDRRSQTVASSAPIVSGPSMPSVQHTERTGDTVGGELDTALAGVGLQLGSEGFYYNHTEKASFNLQSFGPDMRRATRDPSLSPGQPALGGSFVFPGSSFGSGSASQHPPKLESLRPPSKQHQQLSVPPHASTRQPTPSDHPIRAAEDDEFPSLPTRPVGTTDAEEVEASECAPLLVSLRQEDPRFSSPRSERGVQTLRQRRPLTEVSELSRAQLQGLHAHGALTLPSPPSSQKGRRAFDMHSLLPAGGALPPRKGNSGVLLRAASTARTAQQTPLCVMPVGRNESIVINPYNRDNPTLPRHETEDVSSGIEPASPGFSIPVVLSTLDLMGRGGWSSRGGRESAKGEEDNTTTGTLSADDPPLAT